jgi:GTP-binding protein EngB required for normal cell division
MSVKIELLKELEQIKDIISKNSNLIDNSKAEIFIQLAKDIKEFKVYLPLIGNFNAGKSSILNALLEDENLLPTDGVLPKTAIATEIIYDSKNERIEAYNFKSDKVIATFNDLESLKSESIEEYGYLKLYKDSNFLSQNHNIVFVDMPGLDSNIDRHNSQILNYIQKDAISFIVIIDVVDGTIKDSTLRFIEEINSYKLDFFVLINKSDKKPYSELKKIQESIQNQLLRYTDTPFVGVITTFDEDINDIKAIVSKIDKDRYIKTIFLEKIVSNINKVIQDLEIRKNSIQMDTSEIDKKIEQFIDGLYEFDKSLKIEKQTIENRFSTNTSTKILNDIQKSLEQNIDRLITSLKTSEDSFQTTINEIIRPVIVRSINKYTEQEFSLTLQNLEAVKNDIFVDISDFLDKGKSAIDMVSDIIKHTPLLLQIPALAKLLKILMTKINPIVAIISTIVSIASTFFGKSKEEQEREAHEQMRHNIKNHTIPEIIINLESTIIDILETIKEEFFIEIEKSINQQKEELLSSLNMAKEEKERYKSEINKKIDDFKSLISQFNDSIERVTMIKQKTKQEIYHATDHTVRYKQ